MTIQKPSAAVIEELANQLVQRRIDTANKVANAAEELAVAREQLSTAEKLYKQHYQEALANSWTPKELSALGIPSLPRKRASSRSTKPSTSAGKKTLREKPA